jgi:limonene-1,2-epoxide hydrolase
MSTPLEIVRAFCAAWKEPGGDAPFDGWFRPDTVWENHGMVTTTGPDEGKALMQGFMAKGIVSMEFEVLAIAADGNKVLTERIDHAFDGDGNEVAAFRVMGIFEVDDDGKLAAWRDYFDVNAMAGQG